MQDIHACPTFLFQILLSRFLNTASGLEIWRKSVPNIVYYCLIIVSGEYL